MSCQHKLFSRILALTKKSFSLSWNPIKTLRAILFLIVAKRWMNWGVKLQIFGGKKPQSYLIIIRECSRYEFVH